MMKYIFSVASAIVFFLAAYFIPRRITKIEIYANICFTSSFHYTTDMLLDLKYNLYGYMQKGPDLPPILTFLGNYAPYGYIFVNCFPYGKSLIKKVLYILAHSIFIIIYEWLAVKSGYFYYTKWKLWYSALCYPLIFLILAAIFSLIRKLLESDYKKLMD